MSDKIVVASKMHLLKTIPFDQFSIDEMATKLSTPQNDTAYEVVGDDFHKFCRVFIDLDLKKEPRLFKNEKTLNKYNDIIENMLHEFANKNDFLLLTSSMYRYTSIRNVEEGGETIKEIFRMSNISFRLHSHKYSVK